MRCRVVSLIVVVLFVLSAFSPALVTAQTEGCENDNTPPCCCCDERPKTPCDENAEDPAKGNNSSQSPSAEDTANMLFSGGVGTGCSGCGGASGGVSTKGINTLDAIRSLTGGEVSSAVFSASRGLSKNRRIKSLEIKRVFSNRSKAYDSAWGHLWGLDIGAYLLINKTYKYNDIVQWTLPSDWTAEVIFHPQKGAGINNPVFTDNHPDMDYEETWYHDYQPDFVGDYNNEFPYTLIALNSFDTHGNFGTMPESTYADWYRLDKEDGTSWFFCDPLPGNPKFEDADEYTGKAYLKEIRDRVGNSIKFTYFYDEYAAGEGKYYVDTIKEYPPGSDTAVREIDLAYTEFSDGYKRVTALTIFPGTDDEKTIHYSHMLDSGEGDLGKWIMALAEYPDGTWGVYDTGINEDDRPYFEFMDSHLLTNPKARYFIGEMVDTDDDGEPDSYSGNGGIYEGMEVFVNSTWIDKEIREHVGSDSHIRLTQANGYEQNWTYSSDTGFMDGYSDNRNSSSDNTYPGPQMSDLEYEDGRSMHFHYDSVDREDGLHVVRTDYQDGSSSYTNYYKWILVDFGSSYTPYHYHDDHDGQFTPNHTCTYDNDPYHYQKRILTHSETDREGNTTTYYYNFNKTGSGVSFEEHPDQNGIWRPTDEEATVTPLQARMWKKEYADASYEEWTYYETGQKKGMVKTYTDRNGNTYSYDYDANNYISSVTLPDAEFDTISITHNSGGLVTEVTDYAGRTISFTYDEMDKLTRIDYPDGTIKEITYYDECEDVPQDPQLKADFIEAKQALDDPIGRTGLIKHETNRYCPTGNDIYPAEDPIYTCYDYNEYGQKTEETTQAPLGTVHSTTTYTFNNSTLQLVRLEDRDSTIVHEYDGSGRRVKTLRLAESSVVNPDPDTEGVWNVTEKIFKTTTDQLDYTEEYYVRGGTADSIRKRTSYTYDSSGRMSQRKVSSVSNDTQQRILSLVRYEYDSEGRRTKEKRLINGDPETGTYAVTEMWYNEDGRVTHIYNPDGTVRRRWYDPMGNVIQTRNEEAHDFYTEYDSLNRLTDQYGTVSGGNAGFDISFSYTVDATNNKTIKTRTNNMNGAYT
ncbi:MAG: hypothetical protein GF350_04500, partial [Chitinivibrionales bacterium]|nr:hypothetical protein [Chitinivibrionales bacterium]